MSKGDNVQKPLRPVAAAPSGKSKPSLTDHITLAEYGRSPEGALYLEAIFKSEGKIIRRMLPLAGLNPTTPELAGLTNAGAHLVSSAACNELIARIQAYPAKQPTLLVATRLGFIKSTFVLPGYRIGPNKKLICICLAAGRGERFSRYRVGGTRDGCQELMRLADGNSRLMLSVATAFSGPVAALLHQDPINLLLAGPADRQDPVRLCVWISVGLPHPPEHGEQAGLCHAALRHVQRCGGRVAGGQSYLGAAR